MTFSRLRSYLFSDRAAAVAAVFAAAVTLLLPATAAAFQLVPITQEFEPAGRNANKTFRLENPDAREATVSIKVMTREMDIDGREKSEESDDFIVFPTEAIVPPGGVQIVRVQYVGPTSVKEEVPYRIIAEGTPVNSVPGQASQILIAVRYAGTLYVAPPGTKPDITLESAGPAQSGGPNQLEVVLRNSGTGHGIVVDPVLTLVKAGGRHEISGDALKAIAGENVLAGARRRFLLPWPAGVPYGPLDSSNFKAEIER
ncbi:MAG: fimbria/pilus periplasmic chaperone [Gemmatimonas sp.]